MAARDQDHETAEAQHYVDGFFQRTHAWGTGTPLPLLTPAPVGIPGVAVGAVGADTTDGCDLDTLPGARSDDGGSIMGSRITEEREDRHRNVVSEADTHRLRVSARGRRRVRARVRG